MQGPERGFTLLEAVMVIVITGIVAAAAAVFIKAPIQGYADSVRRVQLTDTADTALRRLQRDLRLALPNSVRISNGGKSLEFLLTSGGGRYRAEKDGAGNGDVLDFAAADASFDVLGPVPAAASGYVVVANLGAGSGADAYAGDNRAALVSIAGGKVSFAAKQFPVASPSARFQIVDGPVSYICDPSDHSLRRYAGYTIGATPPAGSGILLAEAVNACLFAYDNAGARSGVVSATLQLQSQGETVNLFVQTHVSNAP